MYRSPTDGQEVYVDHVHAGWVYLRITDGAGGLLTASKVLLETWHALVKRYELEAVQ